MLLASSGGHSPSSLHDNSSPRHGLLRKDWPGCPVRIGAGANADLTSLEYCPSLSSRGFAPMAQRALQFGRHVRCGRISRWPTKTRGNRRRNSSPSCAHGKSKRPCRARRRRLCAQVQSALSSRRDFFRSPGQRQRQSPQPAAWPCAAYGTSLGGGFAGQALASNLPSSRNTFRTRSSSPAIHLRFRLGPRSGPGWQGAHSTCGV
jgi:hypothetical protein